MIGFYLTKTGEYNPEAIEDISNSLILDDKNKKMHALGEYHFDFQRLDASYTSDIDSSAKGLSIYGAGLMYDELGRVDEEHGVAIGRIETSVGYIGSSIGRLDASVNLLEDTVNTHVVDTDIHITAAERTKWDNASTLAHSHANAGILDGLTDASISAWNSAEANVQADWNATEGDASILNRPTLGTAAGKDYAVNIDEASTSDELPTAAAVADFVEGKGYTTNTGTVTYVEMTVPTGLRISGSPVTTSGTLAVSLESGYKIPLDASLTDFQTAYGWGDHSAAGYAQASVVEEVSAYAANVSTWLDTYNTDLKTRIFNVSTYAIDVSTRLYSYNIALNTRIANVSTYAIDVSTYAADVSSRLDTTNALNNTKFETVDASMQQIFDINSSQESIWAAAWEQLFVMNPSLNRPTNY